MLETINKWLDTLELSIEEQVHAQLCIALAKTYDSEGLTSTAAELRRAVNDLKRLLSEGKVEIDPLTEMLTRRED